MTITNTAPADVDALLSLYQSAINYQKTKTAYTWQPFDRAAVQREIEQGSQWKILIDGQIACVFLTTFSDPAIWGHRNTQPAIYIHRIVTAPAFKGQKLVQHIVEWARNHARTHNRQWVRMDTWGDNHELINYYLQFGFTHIDTITPDQTGKLPSYYNCISLALLQMEA